MLAILVFYPVAHLVLPANMPGLVRLGWLSGALACLGLALLWRLYRSGMAEIRELEARP
jgi:hypothetical protein